MTVSYTIGRSPRFGYGSIYSQSQTNPRKTYATAHPKATSEKKPAVAAPAAKKSQVGTMGTSPRFGYGSYLGPVVVAANSKSRREQSLSLPKIKEAQFTKAVERDRHNISQVSVDSASTEISVESENGGSFPDVLRLYDQIEHAIDRLVTISQMYGDGVDSDVIKGFISRCNQVTSVIERTQEKFADMGEKLREKEAVYRKAQSDLRAILTEILVEIEERSSNPIYTI